MQEKYICNEVIRYLGDNIYNYAILIDGEWGGGKTYFVLHELKGRIEEYEGCNNKRVVRYISLYGCNSIEEVEESIYWSIVDESFYKYFSKIVPFNNVYGKAKEKRKSSVKTLYSLSKRIVGTVMNKLNLPLKEYKYIEEFFDLSKNIFIFDDLERCKCSINEILGFINSMVEHEGVKVILIANERELSSINEMKYREIQYLVAAQNNISIPKEKNWLII